MRDDFLKLLYERRSIRKYKKQEISDETLSMLKKSLLLYPSSRDLKPLEFHFVNDRDLLSKLAMSKHGAGFLKNAALGVIVCTDPDKSDVWIEDASIASAIALFAAQSAGLGACWIQIRCRMHDEKTTAEDYVKKILNLGDGLKVESIISIGIPDEKLESYKENDLDYGKINLDHYK